MKIVNLTPHALRIRRVDGTDIVIEPSGIVARLEVSRAECAPVVCEDGVEIAVFRPTFGALVGMPGEDYRKGEEIAYVVSTLCAQSPELATRRDVFAPGEVLRDSAGKIIGCAGLSRVAGSARR